MLNLTYKYVCLVVVRVVLNGGEKALLLFQVSIFYMVRENGEYVESVCVSV